MLKKGDEQVNAGLAKQYKDKVITEKTYQSQFSNNEQSFTGSVVVPFQRFQKLPLFLNELMRKSKSPDIAEMTNYIVRFCQNTNNSMAPIAIIEEVIKALPASTRQAMWDEHGRRLQRVTVPDPDVTMMVKDITKDAVERVQRVEGLRRSSNDRLQAELAAQSAEIKQLQLQLAALKAELAERPAVVVAAVPPPPLNNMAGKYTAEEWTLMNEANNHLQTMKANLEAIKNTLAGKGEVADVISKEIVQLLDDFKNHENSTLVHLISLVELYSKMESLKDNKSQGISLFKRSPNQLPDVVAKLFTQEMALKTIELQAKLSTLQRSANDPAVEAANKAHLDAKVARESLWRRGR